MTEPASSSKVERVSRCPVCGTDVIEQPKTCPRCATPHHRECWDYAGGCAIFGCREQSNLAKASSFAPVPQSPWLEWWMWCMRAYSYSLIALSTTAILSISNLWIGALVDLLFGPQSNLGAVLSELAWSMGQAMGWAVLACLAAFFLLFPIAVISHFAMGSKLRKQLALPRGSSKNIADRLDLGNTTSRLYSALSLICPWLNWLAGLLTILIIIFLGILFIDRSFLWYSGQPLHYVLIVLVSLVIAASPLEAARRRLAHLETLQNRVVASIEAAKGCDTKSH